MQVPKKKTNCTFPSKTHLLKKQNLYVKAMQKTSMEAIREEIENKGAYVIPVTKKEHLLLARLIEAEAEAEPFAGKTAVGAVVVNRVLHPSFPNTILGVIMEPGQFEAVANRRLAAITKPAVESLQAAEHALQGVDPTDGALFFFNPCKTQNQWLKEKATKLSLGSHLFVV